MGKKPGQILNYMYNNKQMISARSIKYCDTMSIRIPDALSIVVWPMTIHLPDASPTAILTTVVLPNLTYPNPG